MWKEIGINLIAIFQEKLGRFIFPKTRLRYNYRKKLNGIVEKISSLFEYAGNRTCSLLNLIRTVKYEVSRDTHLFMKLEIAENKINVLREWYRFYKGRIETCYLSSIGKVFDEFGQILLEVQRIFEGIIKDLKEDAIIQRLKRDTYGYPLAKHIFQTATNEFSKLTGEASQKLKEIKKWENIFSLPEL